MERLTYRLDAMRQRVRRLNSNANNQALQRQVLPDALEELEVALRELQAVEDELRRQREQMLNECETLAAEREAFQSLFEDAPIGYMVTQIDGTIRMANEAVTAALRTSRALLVGRSLTLFIRDGDRRSFRAMIAEVAASKQPCLIETTMQRGDGSAFEVSLTARAVYGKLGRPLALRWIVRDITERKRREASLHARIAELEQHVLGAGSDAPHQPQAALTAQAANIDEAQRRLALFADASMYLSTALDGAAVLERVGRMLVPTLADVCIIDRLEPDGVLRRLTLKSAEQSIRRTFPPAEAGTGLPEQPELIVDLSKVQLNALGRDSAHRKLLRALEPASCIVVPLQLQGQTLGALALVLANTRRPYTVDDLAMASELGRRAVVALDRAQR